MLQQYWQWILQNVPYAHYLDNKYIIAVLILIAAGILAKLILVIFGKYLGSFAKKTKTKVDDIILERIKKPFFYLILAQGLSLSLNSLGINGIIQTIVSSIMAMVFVFIIARVIDVIIEVWGMTFAKKTDTKLDEVLLPLFHKFSKVIFVIIAVMWVLDIWKIDITPYLAGVGIGGLVIGLALQDSLKNILGGISLLLDQTFKVGDKVQLESGEVGEILDIGLRSTKMKTYNNEQLTIPNGYLANTRIQNYTRPNPRIRVVVEFGVAYGSNVEDVQKIILAEITKIKDILEDPAPNVSFVSMGDFALNFKAFFWVENWSEAYSKKLEATKKIYKILTKKNINIPFPTQTIHLKK